ncbi:MAG: radical SAM protein [Brevinematales bacterium]
MEAYYECFPIINSSCFFYIYPNKKICLIFKDKNMHKKAFYLKEEIFQILKWFNGSISLREIIRKIETLYTFEKEKLKSFINSLIENEIIIFCNQRRKIKGMNIIGDGKTIFPHTVVLEITKRCNLRCSYCYNNSAPDKNEELSLDKIKEIFIKLSKNGVVFLEITGGEPMVHKNINEIIKLAGEYFPWFAILSNGTILKEETLILLKEMKSQVTGIQISIDGSCEEVFEKIRGVKSTYKTTIENILKLKENGFPIRVSIVLTKDNIVDLESTCSLVKELGIDHFSISIAQEFGRFDFDHKNCLNFNEYLKNEYKDIFASVYEKYKDIIDNVKMKEALIKTFLRKERSELLNCGAGWERVYIDVKGNVRLCPLISSKWITLGNIFVNDYIKIFNNEKSEFFMKFSFRAEFSSLCQDCEFILYCGGCFAQILLANMKRLKKGKELCDVFLKKGLREVFSL